MPTADELILNNELLERDKQARQAGFRPLLPGEAYERQYNPNSHIFVIQEGNTWSAWRETWQSGKLKAVSCKIIAQRVPFSTALQEAKKYGDYIHKMRK